VQLIRRFRQLSNALPAAELCRKLIEDSGLLAEVRATSRDDSLFQRRRGNLEELAGWLEAARGGGGPGELAAQLALLSHADRDDPGPSVRLMSLHGSKGLEFRYVFIIGVHEGSLPHEASLDEGRLEEERRLMYVGITRAKELLHLSYPKRAKRFGEVVKNEPSRFLSELPDAELHWIGRDAEKDAERREDVAAASLAKLAALLGD
jgi:ATP-dependent DNA helicase Rep